MNLKRNRLLTTLAVAVAGALAASAQAAPVPVKVNLTSLRCIQNYAMVPKDPDAVYLTVTGVAKGADVNKRVPESDTLTATSREPAVSKDKPVALWEGELADGEFALLTVTLFHGKGDEAAKTFQNQLAEATKGVAERSKKTLAAGDVKSLATGTVKAQQGVVAKVKETLPREKNTDHYGGLFNVLVWNNGGKIEKRLDPVGLTAGEHYGNDEKVYTKIKYTRNNVNVKEEGGEEYFPQVMPPISEDKQTVRVKMLETERVKVEGRAVPARNVIDYLADLQLEAGGKPLEWKLMGENVGPSEIHMYWDWAE